MSTFGVIYSSALFLMLIILCSEGLVKAGSANEGWSMDFMSDELYDGRRIRLLTLVDNFTRESLAIEVNDHLGGYRVVEVLQHLMDERSLPKTIRVDNGPEFISKVLDQWAYLWTGVYQQGARPVGLLKRGRTGLQPSRKAHG